jgi:beta-mannosidase
VSGTLIWQLNDCWPVASWSSIDYFGRWKALHYAARRFYAPVLLSVEDNGDSMGLFVTNDTVDAWQGEVRWSLETLGGERLEEGSEPVVVAALSATAVRVIDFTSRITDDNRRERVFVAELWQGEQRCAIQVALFVPNKHLSLEIPRIKTKVQVKKRQLIIQLEAKSLARFVELSLAGVDVVFSDNYFDLPAGRAVSVTCPLPEGWTVEAARVALQVRSLVESY